jgi:hypothetical protein
MKSHTYSPLNHRPARPGITSQRTQITGYLAGAVGTAALLGAPQAEAAVVAVDFGFGATLYRDGQGSTTVGPGQGTINFIARTDDSVVRMGSFLYNLNNFNGGTEGLAKFFAEGTVIGAGGNGFIGPGNVGYGFFHHYTLPILQFGSDQTNKNIGFKTSTGNWGWANVSWTHSTKSLAINSAFVETVANTPITITAVPEPSRALLALAGLGGVALRRRRKQAA